jgi:hypothetical protein
MEDTKSAVREVVLRNSVVVENAPYLLANPSAIILAASSSSNSNSGSSVSPRKKS